MAVKAAYDKAKSSYDAVNEQYAKLLSSELASFETALAQYKDAKEAYEKYMNDNGFQELKDVETAQDLTFQREDGANSYYRRHQYLPHSRCSKTLEYKQCAPI